ncbi:MAG: DNA/RNA nuclease SfsA [Oscillospiraceae bacterium]|nr:DNA/RNA nuclease SfsA [Oscillospiraceae bacterium]
MRYDNIVYGTFLSRPNRFTAVAELCGREEIVHVKNTGRCADLLIKGAKVALCDCGNDKRKTRYDLVAAYSDKLGWVNIDSTAPNIVAAEWLGTQDFTLIRPEYRYGDSRVDFYMERGNERFLMEVKGCTKERGGVGYFPDAPTTRGVKHLKELERAAAEGIDATVAFVIQMNGISEVRPDDEIHPEFGAALSAAGAAGVHVLFLRCRAEADSLEVISYSYA